MVDPRRGVARALHDHARQHGRERRASVDRARPRPLALRARVGRHGLRAHLRGVHAHRRQARRPAGPPARVRGRPRRLHRRVARLRPGRKRRHADRREGRAGHRRGDDEPGDALDHHRHLSCAAARHGDRDLGRCLGARARDRAARRRPALRARELELDLLRQRAGGRAGGGSCAALHRRVARHVERSAS